MIQLTHETLLALIHDASTRVAAQAMAQFAAQHPINPPPPSPRRNRELSSALEEEEVDSEFLDLKSLRHKNCIPPNRGHPRFPSHQGEWRTPIWHLPSLPHGAAPSPLQFWWKHFRRALKYPTSQNMTEQVTRMNTWIISTPKLIGMT
ncbi:UNVERIFIED_CONTAM: hypothetical protein Sangu_2440200 [Sesamum angustifolium]|uniref:Uncharacterized protein n=1 Tax=Sesamum angustifolium TaxID=2727405 RepID=A0AAW2KZT1_9LAMI